TEDEARKLLLSLEEFLSIRQFKPHAQSATGLSHGLGRVFAWTNQFRSNDFRGQLRELCARSPWDRRFDGDNTEAKNELADLASAIIKRPSLLTAELDWLASAEAQSAEMLGFALGKIDEVGNCGKLILD